MCAKVRLGAHSHDKRVADPNRIRTATIVRRDPEITLRAWAERRLARRLLEAIPNYESDGHQGNAKTYPKSPWNAAEPQPHTGKTWPAPKGST